LAPATNKNLKKSSKKKVRKEEDAMTYRMVKFGSMLWVVLVVALCFVAIADDNMLRLAGHFEIPLLDPHATDSGVAALVHNQVCESLTSFKPGTSEVIPQLAERWEVSDDLTTYTFYLRRGINFTDGALFNAEAVKVNIDRMLALGKAPSIKFRGISTVDIVDDYTLRINLSEPSVNFLYTPISSKSGLHILSPKAISEHKTADDPWAADWFSTHLVGTGPYKLVEWIPGDRVILAKNEEYWGGWEGEHIDTIVRRTVPEYTTRKLLLSTGELDMIDNLLGEDEDNLNAIPGVKIERLPTINVGWYMFLFMDDVMWNLDLRKALSWAFPYEEANEIVGWGSHQLEGPIPDCIYGHREDLFVYHTDLDKAAEHLAAAGYKPGELTLILIDYNVDRDRRWFEVFYGNLKQIGVNLECEEMTWGQYASWMGLKDKGKGHITVRVHWPESPEPASYLNLYFEGTEDNPPSLPRGYYSLQLNWFLREAASTKNPERRNYLYGLAQEFIVDQALGIWAVHFYEAVAMRDYVKGFVFTPAKFGVYDFYNMYLEK